MFQYLDQVHDLVNTLIETDKFFNSKSLVGGLFNIE